ncbi:pyridoxamine 5'-phosphate oxidase family protein [Amycolatopsis methanolica]|nr:pyridoxamine 5'-phosphate oxidase family protein [Amycolatopsis methanolica]
MSAGSHRRPSTAMNPEEVAEFLHAGHTALVASHRSDRTIHLVPMWYEIVDGNPSMWSFARSQKVLNLRRDPTVTVLVEAGSEYQELRGVQLTGKARIVDDPAEVLRIGAQIHRKYNAPAEAGPQELPEALRRQAAKRVVIVVTVDRTASWDHRKLGGGY